MVMRLYIFSFLFYILPIISTGQELPPVINYSAEVYGAGNQNWMITQSKENFIYVANNAGILEFNGSNWALYPTPNESIMRSVNAIGDRIYSGFYMDFGYWQRNDFGVLKYTSLSDLLSIQLIEDEQFWNIFHYQKWVLFQSLNRIIIVNPETLEVNIIEPDGLITKMFQLNGELFYQVYGEGLYTLKNGENLILDDSEIARTVRFVGICSINNNIAFITENQGVFLLENQELIAWEAAVNDIISNTTIYSSLQKMNGDLLLGTISNGVIHIDTSGNRLYEIDQTNGLQNNTVLSLFEDTNNNIWMGLDNGIDCMNISSPINILFEQQGRLGTTYTSEVFKDHIYLGTNQGLFYRLMNSNEPFKLIPNTEGQVLSLNIIDESLFCGHNLGTFIIEDNQAIKISEVLGTWDIKTIPERPDLLLQGNYDGLYLLSKINGTWSFDKKIVGFDYSSKHFELASNKKVLVSHEYKGVFEINLSDDYSRVIDFEKITSLNRGIHAGLQKFDNNIYYTNSEGVFKSELSPIDFKLVPELSVLLENNEYSSGTMISDDYNRLWFFTKSNLIAVSKDNIDESYKIEKISLPNSSRKQLDGYENITFTTKSTFIYGNSSGYLFIDLEKFEPKVFHVLFSRITASQNNGTMKVLPLKEGGNLDYKMKNFTFDFSVPVYDKYLLASYQYRIPPFQDSWSPWTQNSSYSVKNLTPGEYTFEVRAKINDELLEDVLKYKFVILSPWYLSNAAYVIYFITFVIILFLIDNAYRNYYKQQRDRHLIQKTKDLELRELATQKEIIELKNEKLSHEIEARNRELAISTMNMISKTSTLNSLKEQLIDFNEDNKLKPVIGNINKIINNKKDWEFFEKAFNHADKKFFKKLKERHPELTPNDLRLCVYLRLNLTSKEIAPLLNISHRSVEIKRYRLRKKLDLERDTNLNDYFINL